MEVNFFRCTGVAGVVRSKERSRVCRKKDDGNGVAGKEEKKETKEKIFRCSEKIYEGSCCEGDGR